MNTFKKVTMVGVLLISSSLMLSTQVHAEQFSLEKQAGQILATQGKKVMMELKASLRQSIKKEVSTYFLPATSLGLNQVTNAKKINAKNTNEKSIKHSTAAE